MSSLKLDFIASFFSNKGYIPLPYQKDAWKCIFEKASGLICVPTGAGKTYAAYMGALANVHHKQQKGLQILYITPLRALARDLEEALRAPIIELDLPYRVESRTGDTSSATRQKQSKNPPEILLTTPESFALLLSQQNAHDLFKNLDTVIVDEWHELLGTKRGTLLELCLSRIKPYNPDLSIWGLTATVGNLKEAASCLVGQHKAANLITADLKRDVIIESILPQSLEMLPWAGQLGLKMLSYLLDHLSMAYSSLIFTNTRAQAERWHQAIWDARPDFRPYLALHHGSIDKKLREDIEQKLKIGILKCVVATSSLDLGVDFSPVERVFQIGSPKSIARLMQRAGRSSHKPLTPCRIGIVPTHAMEIAEIAAFRQAFAERRIESRIPLENCYDVLIQHMITCAIGGGFTKEGLFSEVKTAYSYRHLSDESFSNCLEFLMHGGKAFSAYPEYKKLIFDQGTYKVQEKRLVQFHRMNIGTIASDPQVPIKLMRGKLLGVVEENFITSLQPNDHFLFGGKVLELVQYRDLCAYVRLSRGEAKTTAIWQGGRMPYSSSLGELLRKTLYVPNSGFPEEALLRQIGSFQRKISAIPGENELLIEQLHSREGWHLFIYPFEGRLIHQALAYLIAARLANLSRTTFKISCNDYGFELLSHDPIDVKLITPTLFATDRLEEEISQLLNLHEIGKSYFRDIARIAGIIFQGYPGKHKSARQVQVSSSILYEVITKYDKENVLVKQTYKETLDGQFETNRLSNVLKRLHGARFLLCHPKKFSPFALPLFIERVSGHLTTETIAERIEKIKRSWTKA